MQLITALSRRSFLAGAAALGALALLPRMLRAQAAREIVEMSMGSPEAPATMVEYSSFTCPHCAAFHADVLPQIKANYIDTGQVRLILREVYFDRPGLWASMVARCAGADRFFGVANLLFRDQAEWSRAADAAGIVAGIQAIGRQAGLTDAAMDACLQDNDFAQALVADYQRNANADGIDATPTFVINGEKVSNMPYAGFEAKLNEVLGA